MVYNSTDIDARLSTSLTLQVVAHFGYLKLALLIILCKKKAVVRSIAYRLPVGYPRSGRVEVIIHSTQLRAVRGRVARVQRRYRCINCGR